MSSRSNNGKPKSLRLDPPWLKHVRAATESEFRKEKNKVNKIRMHLFNSKELRLNKNEKYYFDLIRKVFVILCDNYTQQHAINLVQELGRDTIGQKYSLSKAGELMSDAMQLYGNAIKRNKQFDRMMTIEKLKVCYEKLMEDEKWDKAADVMGIIGKYQQLDKSDGSKISADDLNLPELLISSDPKALFQAQNTEDAEIDEEEE